MEISLLELQAGKEAKIVRLDEGCGFGKKIATLNLRVGKTVKKITTQPLAGPVVLEIDNTKVALGRGMAMKIFVEVKI